MYWNSVSTLWMDVPLLNFQYSYALSCPSLEDLNADTTDVGRIRDRF